MKVKMMVKIGGGGGGGCGSGGGGNDSCGGRGGGGRRSARATLSGHPISDLQPLSLEPQAAAAGLCSVLHLPDPP
ncbi:hypothetical protein L3X38_008436 [Prunus dulcis]|uniref:Uncharacterized protein n=1 Tax=Prunus dulcis TaxID=3755 RepID=A0AAD4ZWM8_PRUDU|nr:hypothetical protein L3X38_008436 [Prunus dulcis]